MNVYIYMKFDRDVRDVVVNIPVKFQVYYIYLYTFISIVTFGHFREGANIIARRKGMTPPKNITTKRRSIIVVYFL